VVLALVPASSGTGGVSVPTILGFAEDAPKYGDYALFDNMNELGFAKNRWTIFWDETKPTTIGDEAFIDAALPRAKQTNVTIVFSITPLRPAAIGANDARQAQFCALAKKVAQKYFPQGVVDYIIGNEPNKHRFWQPQYAGGQYVAARDYEHTLARCYDELKSVDEHVNVIGLALGADGSDNPNATVNPSRSPVRFINEFAGAYKESGRVQPVLDELALHPYPDVQDTDPPEKGYRWPNVGVPNLDRVKQAVWDGFRDTQQPVFLDEPGGFATDAPGAARPFVRAAPPPTLKLTIDEIGWQTKVAAAKQALYHGRETVAPVEPSAQADYYARMLRFYLCDSLVREVLIFHLIDETDLDRFQSGLLWADHSKKDAYDVVARAAAETQRLCSGQPIRWRHTERVIGAKATWTAAGGNAFSLTAGEDVTYSAGIFPATGLFAASPNPKPIKAATGTVKAYFNRGVAFPPAPKLKHGRYVYRVTLAAAMNGARTTTLTSPAFTR
jgi:hypothetical protein